MKEPGPARRARRFDSGSLGRHQSKPMPAVPFLIGSLTKSRTKSAQVMLLRTKYGTKQQ